MQGESDKELERARAELRKLIGSLDEAGENTEKRLQEGLTHAKLVLDSIARVMYRDMGFRETASKAYP